MSSNTNCGKTGIRLLVGIGTYTLVLLFFASIGSAATDAGQRKFSSGEEATAAFLHALKSDNNNELLKIFGPEADELMHSGDVAADKLRRARFLAAFTRKHSLSADKERLILSVGENDWPFPIPLVKEGNEWIFDTLSGKEEILDRRVGQNELSVIQTMMAIVDAQREYAMKDRDGDGLLEYAQKFRSTPGQQDGLHWPTADGEEPSPLGDLVAKAREEEYYMEQEDDDPRPYHGYFYRILTSQGPYANGGSFDYIVQDNMMGGFAVIAHPAAYGNSGVMTFMVNHNDIVFQKNLGEDTEQKVNDIKMYSPDKTWAKAQEEPVK